MTKKEIQEEIRQAVETVRRTNPMAGSITNTVTINFVANAQLAVGGSAAMVYLPDEGEFLAKAGGALYINVGTLLPVYEQTLPHVAKALHETGKPWVLDPVAVGIGTMRTKLLRLFKEYKPTIIRGNASEVIALAGLWELAEAAGVGLEVDETAIPVLPETKLLCTQLGLDPLGLIGSGALLLADAQEDAAAILAALEESGIAAARIGRVVEREQGVVLRSAEFKRPLPRFDRDEIARLFE